MKLNIETTNLAEFITATEVALKKAEELQKAIQRLNAIELKISTSYDKEY